MGAEPVCLAEAFFYSLRTSEPKDPETAESGRGKLCTSSQVSSDDTAALFPSRSIWFFEVEIKLVVVHSSVF